MKDRLQEIFDKQKEFNNKLYPELKLNICPIEHKESVSKDMAFSAIRELTELIDETNWKRHQLIRKDVNLSNVIEEAVDVFKFYLNILIIWGFDADDLFKEFNRKSNVVEQKWKQEVMLSSIKETDRIVCVDIDGVLGNYTGHFLDYVHHTFQECLTEEKSPGIQTISKLVEYLGREQYNIIKHRYRSDGVKANMPVVKGAKELLVSLQRQGYKVILLSARPYKDYPRIWADTLEWLNKNALPFDAIIFDRDKEDLVTKLFPGMKYFIDDDKNNIKKVEEAGYKCIFVGCNMKECNFDNNVNVRCAQDLDSVKGIIEYENSHPR